MKKTVCIDFDGVIHSYTSGWQGPLEIPDPCVEATVRWMFANYERFDLTVFSSRSRHEGAIMAMSDWLHKECILIGLPTEWLLNITWAREKPPAVIYIDDRGYCFQGTMPHPDFIETFTPWNK